MKTYINLFFALFLLSNLNSVSAQSIQEDQLLSFVPQNWELSENWLHDYRSNLGSQASLTWINETLSEDTYLLTSEQENGLILIGTEENEDDLTAGEFSQTAFLNHSGNHLVPVGAAEAIDLGATTEWRGQLEGQEVIVHRACFYAGDSGEFITMTLILPLHSHDSEVSPLETGISLASRIAIERANLVSNQK